MIFANAFVKLFCTTFLCSTEKKGRFKKYSLSKNKSPSLLKILILFWGFSFFTACDLTSGETTEVCFIGDSITDLWDVQYHFPDQFIHKYGVGGAKIEDVQKWDVSVCQNKRVILLIGTNNIPFANNDSAFPSADLLNQFVSNYSDFIKKLKPEKLYAISILPRRIIFKESKIIFQIIPEWNQRLQSTLETSNIPYQLINAYPKFLKKESSIQEDYFSDGIHLSEEGYGVLSAIIRGAL